MTPMEQIPIIRLHDEDSVVVARCDLAPGLELPGGVVVKEPIPAGHKLAVKDIAAGESVRKYNQIIGQASQAIAKGSHVHTHNLTMQSFVRDGGIGVDAKPTDLLPPDQRASFMGIVRADGRVATRNYIGIVTTVNCSATVARHIAKRLEREIEDYPNVDGVVAITHGTGCGMAAEGEPIQILRRTIAGYANHVNFAAVLVVGLGCETNQIKGLGLQEGPNLRTLAIQDTGGTSKTIEEGVAILRDMLERANRVKREKVPASHLVVGLQCGGSDGYSGITANPALGAAVDILVRHGGTAVLSETPEIYGAEHLLTRRAQSAEIAAKLLTKIRWWEDYTSRNRGSMDNNPSPGNKAGGLTTILEKSLGAAMKGGTSNLVDVVGYAEPVTAKGLVFMDTPGYDPVSATGQVAGGANLLCFTTGRGSVFGGKPTPCLKLATNTPLYRKMTEDMDINCGPIADGAASVQEIGEQIFQLMLATASGQRSKSELLGFGDEEFQPWQLDAVM
jgi:altronate hydrolase